jgi:hypothetical protein
VQLKRRRSPAPGSALAGHSRGLEETAIPASASRARKPRARAARSSMPMRLPSLGVFGFDRLEPVILAALVTEDPLLLIGRSGTGKTYLLNTLSEALELEHRHYNASGFPGTVNLFLIGRSGRHDPRNPEQESDDPGGSCSVPISRIL